MHNSVCMHEYIGVIVYRLFLTQSIGDDVNVSLYIMLQ